MKTFYTTIFLLLYTFLFSHNISYISGNYSLDQVQKRDDWRKLNSNINNGLNNGVFWFKINTAPSIETSILNLPEAHIFDTELYFQSDKIPLINHQRFITYELANSKEAQTYYLKVNAKLEARIPIKLNKSSEYYQSEQNYIFRLGLYTGIVLSILLFNLFSYFSFKNVTYLHYMFMVLGVAGNALYKDGLTSLVLGIHGFNQYIEPTINSIPAIAAIFFVKSYLNLTNEYKTLRHIGIGLVILTIIFNIGFIFSYDTNLFVSATVISLISIDIFWLTGTLLWHKSLNAKFFSIAYGVPLLIAHDYYISPFLGIDGLGELPLWFYELGSIFEMVFFTYVIMYEAKSLALENRLIREKLNEYTIKINDLIEGKFQSEDGENKFKETFNLSEQEVEILKDISLQLSNKQIAEKHFISENTVKYHLKKIFNKLEVKSRLEAGKVFINFNTPD